MKKLMGLGVVLATVAACDQRPVEGGDVVDETPIGLEPVVENGQVGVGDILAANYSPGATEPLVVRVSLDGGVRELQVYGVYAGGEIDDLDYESYSFQDGGDSRFFRGFARESSDGSVNAVVVSDGGQFNRFFGGAVANQIDYSAPSGGLVRYRGEYVGLVNFGAPNGTGAPGALNGVPIESYAVTGDAFILADFTEGAVNGEIFNRSFEDGADLAFVPDDVTSLDLPEIVLVVGDIAGDGSFTGTAELTELEAVGTYGGLFGGDDASSVAGLVRLEAGFLGVVQTGTDPDTGAPIFTPIGTGAEVEHGIFVLDETEALD
ncbi:hypothetical protein [Yoonia litorea]|uniref:Transferrin-binding protein B C-lobe/N-lobe beta barrel domain-containing protein n=1 Tax=Yoonia litorea TaxID=1123755 RepID=A0A1I6MHD5_9RHOB|nr:hypothetical protein [Yoonia litorea]SFS15125.1 hypothetical protein SAMN05444714_1807 [Yoonia litorea]